MSNNKKNILVTGGLGYIGSHTVVELVSHGYEVCIIDDLSNSKIEVLKGISDIIGYKPDFHKLDLKNVEGIKSALQGRVFDGAIHFAAHKAVGESVKNPIKYYRNNIVSLLNLLEHIQTSSIIFSSSCTVYGQADYLPIVESAPIKKAESPYGATKQMGEQILQDVAKATHKHIIALRYFNPIGAHQSIAIGELPLGIPDNLIPYVTQTAAGIRKELSIFGNDYNTKDGTALRDYIYVCDLAEAHVLAMQRLVNNESESMYETYNLGSGTGATVKEVVDAFEEVTGVQLPHRYADRRTGDIEAAYADYSKAQTKLGWKPKTSIETALKTAWEWQKRLSEKPNF